MLLFRPLFLAFKNHIRSYRNKPRTILRDGIVISLVFVFGLLIYSGMRWMLLRFVDDQQGVYLAPQTILAFSINIFLPLAFLSSFSAHLSNFYTSEDLELIFASPISKTRFYIERCLVTSIESSWMVFVAITPFLLSFVSVYKSTVGVIFAIPFCLVMLMLIPALVSSIFGIFWNLILLRIPQQVIVGAIFVILAYLFVELISILASYLIADGQFDGQALLSGIRNVASFGELRSPAVWIARLLSSFLEVPNVSGHSEYTFWSLPSSAMQLHQAWYSILLMISVVGMLTSAGLLLNEIFYTKALSYAWGQSQKPILLTSESRFLEQFIARRIPVFRKFFALLKRELVLFLRDSSLMVQVVFLLCMLGMYLYMLRFQANFQMLFPATSSIEWKTVLILVNLSVESFLTIAIASRLLFPSISREGRAIWILQKSPVSTWMLVLAKFLFWVTPMVIAVGLLGGLSHYLTYGQADFAIIKATMVGSGAGSVAALAMFLGAKFAYFNWESRSQLIASFGSVVFMVCGLILAVINVLSSVLLLTALGPYHDARWVLLAVLVLYILLHLLGTMILLFLAQRSLHTKLGQQA